MAFWSTVTSTSKEPKRNFRFKVSITSLSDSGNGSMVWFAKTCDKPSFTIETTEHQFLNHTFYYPGAVKWQAISMQLVDPADPDAVSWIASILAASGYQVPGTATQLGTMTKASATSALKQVEIMQLDGDGLAIETWTLQNAFITEAKFGSLEYGSDDLTAIDLTLQYDWAMVAATGNNANADAPKTGQTYFKLGESA